MTEQSHLSAPKTPQSAGAKDKAPKQQLKDKKTQALAAALRANLQRRKKDRATAQSDDQNTNGED